MEKSRLNQKLTTKVLQMLENKRLIKSMTPVQVLILFNKILTLLLNHFLQDGKKMFLLYEVIPDESLTGPWWFNGQFNHQFVDYLQKTCVQFLEKKLESAKRLDVLQF